ncbi:DNA sulfur modification protein DndE [Colwellia sp. 1_MG-2023]|uniref:DNA sulfur modification protein DndE n=1 Tax=unclassified Colwellia TaxID=196834 RepID=UPI001C092E30|nr:MULTISPECIES: DNA sulfur modification protein DndE [unclassified Colwellia]MBU2925802.1 DNA sulfur modification protein DndE [Colwellia sp. C2M11]MDO6650971.1 DNA sulfur modification protein DndE [Colwellia sp. 3_MG-2023]MDO6664006.1 DNA sulfur modification protein DndE [Colwellia sp. 2_MG-2023]MDO6688357.1 DNA sulfur modification protein DndE [Colwellia sp. 1_MG-2023]
MLPNRMQLTKTVEDQLKRLKTYTDITPNVSARIAFFRSVESGFTFTKSDEKKLDGSLVLDKITWLGETQLITEQVLKLKYPELEGKALQSAWAAHVEDGIAALRNHKSLYNLVSRL